MRRRIDRLIRDADETVVVIEAIKLLEGPLKNIVDAVWVVDASAETQMRRLINQRGFSEDNANQRIESQNTQADKLRQADVIIENNAASTKHGRKCFGIGQRWTSDDSPQ